MALQATDDILDPAMQKLLDDADMLDAVRGPLYASGVAHRSHPKCLTAEKPLRPGAATTLLLCAV